MPIPPLVLKIVADTSGMKTGVAQANAQVGGLRQSIAANAGAIKLALGAAVVGGFALATKAAADLGESQNKANVIFEDSVGVVNRFASSAAQGFGLAKGEALEGAASFGAMFNSARIMEDESARMSVKMSQLAGDMASFNNQDPSEMLERLRSGLAGEAEPLRRFGVFISEARVQTEAYRLGLAETGEELTDAQKIQARYAIILQDTTKAQGDFARTLGESLPNQLRVLRAEVINIAASLGSLFLPIVVEAVKIFRGLLGILADNKEVLAGLLVVFLAYKAINFLPNLLLSIALAAERVGAAGLASGLLSAAGGASAAAAAFPPVVAALAVLTGGVLLFKSAQEAANHQTDAWLENFRKQDLTLGEARAKLADYNEQVQAGNSRISSARDGLAAYVAALEKSADASESTSASTIKLAEAHKKAAGAAHEQRIAELQLAGGFLGLIGAADQLQAAHKELNELQRKGKQGTEAYRDATLSGLEAQLSLEQGLADYAKELHDAGQTQRDVIGTVRELAREFGLQGKDLRALLADVRDYIGGLQSIPSRVSTTVSTILVTREAHFGSRQHGGPVSAFTPYIVGERGPEMFVPSTSGTIIPNGGGGSGGDLILQIDGQTFARISRDELLKLKGSRVSLGLG